MSRHLILGTIIILGTLTLTSTLSAREKSSARQAPKSAPCVQMDNSQNLIPNGSLEQGKDSQPKHWAPLDQLTSFWMKKGGNPGKCLKLDTTVLTKDKKKFKESPQNFWKEGGRSKRKGGLYDNIGAHEGAWAFPQPVDLSPKQNYYILSADIKAPAKAEVRIFIRGFNKVTTETAGQNNAWFHDHFHNGIGYSDTFGSKDLLRNSKPGDYVQVYRHTLVARIQKPNTWETHRLGFKLPSIKRFRPERLLIKVYAYWPSGIYYYDNISLVPATKEQIKAVNDARPSVLK